MKAYTKGSWTVGGKGNFLNQIEINPAIGCAYGVGAEVTANARLIAAAPDLYEALEDLLENYKENKGEGLGIGPIMKAKQALAKARGESVDK